MFTYVQIIGFVATGFEATKFLHKSEPTLWSIVNCRKLTIYDGPLQAPTCLNKDCLGPSLEDRKSQFCHAAAKKCCGSGNLLICPNCR